MEQVITAKKKGRQMIIMQQNVSSARLQCAKNGDFEKFGKGVGTAVAYGWYVWEKGFTGKPTIEWI